MSAQQQRRRRPYIIAGVSLGLHALVLGWLARPLSPGLFGDARDLAVMSAELIQPTAVEDVSAKPLARSEQIPDRLRQARPEAPRLPPSGPDTEGLGGYPATPMKPEVPDSLRAAIRAGASCTGVTLDRLSPREREKCQEKLGRLSASAPRYDTPMDPAKRTYFDQVAAAGLSSSGSGDPQLAGVSPGSAHVRLLKCSVSFGVGRKPREIQGTVRLGKSPCAVPLQGSFFTPEATVQKR